MSWQLQRGAAGSSKARGRARAVLWLEEVVRGIQAELQPHLLGEGGINLRVAAQLGGLNRRFTGGAGPQ